MNIFIILPASRDGSPECLQQRSMNPPLLTKDYGVAILTEKWNRYNVWNARKAWRVYWLRENHLDWKQDMASLILLRAYAVHSHKLRHWRLASWTQLPSSRTVKRVILSLAPTTSPIGMSDTPTNEASFRTQAHMNPAKKIPSPADKNVQFVGRIRKRRMKCKATVKCHFLSQWSILVYCHLG